MVTKKYFVNRLKSLEVHRDVSKIESGSDSTSVKRPRRFVLFSGILFNIK